MHACPGGIGPVAPSPFPFPHVPFPRVPLLCPHSTSPMPGSHCCAFCPRSSLHSPAFTSVKLQHVLCCGSGLSSRDCFESHPSRPRAFALCGRARRFVCSSMDGRLSSQFGAFPHLRFSVND